MIANWSTNRGPRCKTTPKDAFLLHCLFAIYLQNEEMIAQTAQKTYWKVLFICSSILKEAYVRDVSMYSFLYVGILSHNNFKYAHHDTDEMATENPIHLVIIKSPNHIFLVNKTYIAIKWRSVVSKWRIM